MREKSAVLRTITAKGNSVNIVEGDRFRALSSRTGTSALPLKLILLTRTARTDCVQQLKRQCDRWTVCCRQPMLTAHQSAKMRGRHASIHSPVHSQGHPVSDGQAPKDDQARNTPHKPAKHLIAVASGKGGVGKSTTSINLALAIANKASELAFSTPTSMGRHCPG